MSNLEKNEYIKEKIGRIKNKKRIIFLTIIITTVLAAIEAFSTYDEYDTTVSVIPEIPTDQGSVAGSLLQQFSGLGGLGLGGSLSGNSTIPPQLYSKVVNSTPFILYLFEKEVYFKRHDLKINVQRYFEEYHREPIISSSVNFLYDLPWKILRRKSQDFKKGSLPEKEDSPIFLTKNEEKLIINLRKRITVTLDPKTGILKLVIRMPDRLASAELASIILSYLKEYVTIYRKQKAQRNMNLFGRNLRNQKQDLKLHNRF
jgi:hypothetical protein